MKREYDKDGDIQDLHATGGGGDVEAVTEEIYGGEGGDFDPMEIWLESVDEDQHLDVNDFPPLPDFPCMSSSSSTSSVPAGVVKPSSSSSASSSSSSAASWAVLKSDGEEDPAAKKFHLHPPQPAMTPSASMDASCGGGGGVQPPPEDSFTDDDCINVMENLGYMDFINGDDICDPITIFQTENFPPPPPAAFEGLQQQQEDDESKAAEAETETADLSFLQGNGELAAIFFDWLKQNKDYISAEDMRNIKLKRSTIESASKRLGSSKEGKKQLLKLILEWVQQYQLQKKNSREEAAAAAAAAAADHQSSGGGHFQAETFLQDTTPSCFFQSPWTPPPPQYIPDANNAAMMAPPPPFPVFQPHAMGYNDPYNCGGASFTPMNVNGGHFPHPTEYHQPAAVDTAQSWQSSEFIAAAAAPPFNPFPDNDRIAAESAQPQDLYGSEYPYQLYDGNGERLVRLGSSATKEARKKRMARQRRLSSHHFRHQNHHNNQHHHAQNYDPHHAMRMGVDTVLPHQVSNLGNWVYWSPAASEAQPPMVVLPPAEAAAQPHPVERPPPAQQQNHQKQSSSDRRQGSKPEKNLKFLLQKVLKQSDVGSLGRIVLPKKEAETQLPELESRDGISIAMEDIGTSRVWNMKYRFWPNNKSRMYLLENTGDFVRANGLQEGDFIVIYADMKCGKYLIRGVKVRQHGARSEGKKPARKNPRTSSPATTSPAISSLIKQAVN
nr:B3 domain-containing transcription factor ABI3-like [Ipomoea batatas]